MKRAILIFIAIGAVIPVSITWAAEIYPTRPVRMIVPYSPGGNADIQARYAAERLTETLGKQFVVDNRSGASGIIGMELAARSPADGYTVLFVGIEFAVNPGLFKKLPYDNIKDFQPISLVGETPLLFVANAAIAASNVKEVIMLAQKRPGQLRYGSSGSGSPAHLAASLLEMLTGARLVHVPYKGTAQAILDTISGQIELTFPSMTSVLPHVKAGRLKAFAITVKSRSALAPDIPTMTEAGVASYETSIWNGLLVPVGTPKEIVDRLNQTIVQILRSPQARQRYDQVGAEIRYNSPAEFQAFIRSETTKWASVIRAAGIRVEQ